MLQLAVALACIAQTAFPEAVHGQVVLESQVDTQNIAVGEPIRLSLRLDHDLADEARWDWPSFSVGDTLDGGWEVLRTGTIDTLMSDAFATGRQLLQRVEITHWDSGLIAIAPLVFIDTVGDEKLTTRPIQIRVTVPVVPPEIDLRDIQGFESIEWTLGERLLKAMPWALGLLVLTFIIWHAVKYWKNRDPESNPTPAPPAPPAEPHHLIALRALRELDKAQLWQKGDEKNYHGQLTAVVKTFIQGQFDTPMVDRSTAEIRRSLFHPPAGLAQEKAAQFMALLDSADAVKFAKHKPGPDVHERAMRQAIILVEALIPEDIGRA